MNKIYFSLILSTLLISLNVSGEEKMVRFNSDHRKQGKETVSSIQVNGSVVLNEAEILGLVQVNGSLKADASKIHTLQVNGQANLNSCVIHDTAIVNGSLSAKNTQFQQELSVSSEKIILKMCSVNSLVVRKTSGTTRTEIVDLRDGTRVKGTVTVESGNGEVWISSNSELLPSQVYGAKVCTSGD